MHTDIVLIGIHPYILRIAYFQHFAIHTIMLSMLHTLLVFPKYLVIAESSQGCLLKSKLHRLVALDMWYVHVKSEV
jgi:hypothetical protein